MMENKQEARIQVAFPYCSPEQYNKPTARRPAQITQILQYSNSSVCGIYVHRQWIEVNDSKILVFSEPLSTPVIS